MRKESYIHTLYGGQLSHIIFQINENQIHRGGGSSTSLLYSVF